jgi:DNA-binding XRE family transcriptional regulator
MARGGDTKPKTKPFRQLADKIDADPARRARVDEHKRVMLAELRQSLDLTQTELAETLDVSQRGVSHVEHEANPRLGTLADYVDALGGRLELRAVFDDRTVELTLPTVSTRKRSSTRAQGRPPARS